MTKDCGCDKKPKGELNKIWKYIKGYEPIQINNTSASYQGKNGFRYQTNNGLYVVFFTFSIINNNIIKYFITLSKIKDVKINKKTNTRTTFLKCKKQFIQDFSVKYEIIKHIIDNISNNDFTSTPHNSYLFNNAIIDIIKQGEKKEGLTTTSVYVQQQDKSASEQGCEGSCVIGGPSICSSGCAYCNTLYTCVF
jgi:hypothetical protein